MSSHAHTALTTLGFSFGFVGIVGLVISLIALIPLNAYNIALSIHTAAELSNAYGDGSILIPGPYRPVQIFLFGSVGFSIMTMMLLLATCWRNASARQRNRKSRGKRVGRERRGSKASSIAESIRSSQSDHSILTHPSLQNSTGGWLGKGSTLIFMLQFCWAIFGSHTLFYDESSPLPPILRKSAITSLLILWTNYAIMICFSIVFCFAACCVLMGGISSNYDDEEEDLENHRPSERSPLIASSTMS